MHNKHITWPSKLSNSLGFLFVEVFVVHKQVAAVVADMVVDHVVGSIAVVDSIDSIVVVGDNTHSVEQNYNIVPVMEPPFLLGCLRV